MAEIKNQMPEGIEFINIGIAGDEDFELLGDYIRKGKRPGAMAQVLVRPAPGYSFQPSRVFDINKYEFTPGPEGQYMAVQQFAEPVKVRALAVFAITNEFDRQIVEEALSKLKNLPGYVETVLG